ncbi:Plasminogen activator inhibitor [Melia azedarach]|uniref:Plasminogen activator inhibitor n=1 Tax=Melia azedarach TaxID=155640 RepID=A0ACC1YUB3_MELAZ|nr:Plasminogen activator inhibitor [Melia azedarach]
MIELPSIPLIPDFAIDLATLSLISFLLLLSFFSLCLIFYLHFKTQNTHYLQRFNALWTVRLLLVFIIILWTLNENLRLPLLRRNYLYLFFQNLTLFQQSSLCKVHLVLSLGFLEPGFLVTLLFLLHVSIKKKTPRGSWAFALLLAVCLPLSVLQFLFVFFQRLEKRLPMFFRRSSVIFRVEDSGEKTVLCSYPLLSTCLFGGFIVVYLLYFLFSCWSVVSLVINKKLRIRTYTLAFAVLTSIALQVLFLGLSVLWTPEKQAFGLVTFLAFLSTFTCAVVGQGILVISPIADSLAVGGRHFCRRWHPPIWSRPDDHEFGEGENV